MALLVQKKALDAVQMLRPIAAKVRKHDGDLHNQLRRAMNSVILNLGEGAGVAGGNARLRFGTACGSAKGVRVALQAAVGWGFITLAQTEPIDRLLDEVCAMSWRLSGR